MLSLTKKQYEIEEKVLINDEKGNELYSFMIQLTADELEEVKKLIFDEETEEKARKLQQLEKEENYDELISLEKEITEQGKVSLSKFEKLIYKENLVPFKNVAGESYYNEMTEKVYGFFFKYFVDKRLDLTDTMTSRLRKNGIR